jgi:hypothetical protein
VLSGDGSQQAADVLQETRLARPRRTHDRRDAALRNVEGDVLENRVGAERFCDPP